VLLQMVFKFHSDCIPLRCMLDMAPTHLHNLCSILYNELMNIVLSLALTHISSPYPSCNFLSEVAQMSAFLALQQQHGSTAHHHVQESAPDVRASMLTLNFNPMEEPSWLPHGPMVSFNPMEEPSWLTHGPMVSSVC
jgi:hypothetical protein